MIDILTLLGHFFHGLIFFTLSLVVVVLHYRSRRISLARHLTWLGIFAMCEAVFAWYRLLALLLPWTPLLPAVLPPMLLALGYAFLLSFGIQTFMSKDAPPTHFRRLLLGLNIGWIAIYVTGLAFVLPQGGSAAAPFANIVPQGAPQATLLTDASAGVATTAEVVIRYLLGFSGGLLAAFGLRRQSYHSLEHNLRQRIRPYLRLIEVMIGLFGVLNILLVPVSPLPAALLAHEVWPSWIWTVVGAGLVLGLIGSLTTIQREIETWVEGVERLQALAKDRERIGRELHDGIIQSIYAAGLLLESIQTIIASDPQRAQAQLGRVQDSLNTTIQDIRRYIFDLRSDISDDDIQPGIERLLRDFHINTLLETDFEVIGTERPIHSMERRRHLFQIVREALANTAKHAQARWVKVCLDYGDDNLILTISDDGIGMEKLLVSKGYGLRNIRERARLLDGALRIESAPDAGVTYHLTVPYTRG
jgi:signal transduction histidine kinase